MGYRVHYATTYKVEYGNGRFNHQSEGFNTLLIKYCENFYGDEEDSVYSKKIEVLKEDLQKAILSIKELKESPLEEYSIEDIVEFLEEALEKGESDNDYIVFYWF